jgi:hypothetical protein
MGATFVNEILLWQGQRISITLAKYDTKITDGAAVIQTVESERRRTQEETERQKAGKKDL